MNAVVSLLDTEHTTRVTALWEELERDFGVRDVLHGRYALTGQA